MLQCTSELHAGGDPNIAEATLLGRSEGPVLLIEAANMLFSTLAEEPVFLLPGNRAASGIPSSRPSCLSFWVFL